MMRVTEGRDWGARRASLALVLAVIAVAAMPLFAHFAAAVAGVLTELAARPPVSF